MDRGAAVLVAAGIGGLLATQAPLNSQLGRVVGDVQASVLAVGISWVALAAFALLFAGGTGTLARAGEAPVHVLVGGGLIGALYVGSIVFTVRALGVGGLTALTVGAQLAVAVVIDHFGWLGAERSPIDAGKLAGIALLAAGTYLVIRD
jgi:transporter family-2 protein